MACPLIAETDMSPQREALEDEMRSIREESDFAGTLPRVLYAVVLDPMRQFGSLEEQIVSLTRSFRNNGSLFRPLFICDETKNVPKHFQGTGGEFDSLDLRSFSWSRMAALSRMISRDNITLIHWNFTEKLRNGYLWWLTIRHPCVRHCFTDHISRSSGLKPAGRFKRTVKGLLARRYDKVFCVSQFILDDSQRHVTSRNLALSRQFVNTERFRPDAEVRAHVRNKCNAGGRFVVLAVAHLTKAKGIDVLIRAIAGLPENVVLWVVGDGVEAQNLRKLSHELQVVSRVHFHGSQVNVAPFMQAADCLACPSIWGEAAGLVNLEANACGLPVVASRVGGIPEYVLDGRTGLLFSAGDPSELARHILFLRDNDAFRRDMGVRAREHALEKFTMEIGIRNHLKLYQQ